MTRFAYFVSPHGFGHASRASAVMAAVQESHPGASFEIFTSVPEWFFGESLADGFTCHDLVSDIGMVQVTPMQEDLAATIDKLERFLPFTDDLITPLARQVADLGCSAVLCDIAPMGIAVAREAGVPSVLIENFTWDWIYEGYASIDPRIGSHMAYLRELFASADMHVQTRPVCLPDATADLVVEPVSRNARKAATEARSALSLSTDTRLILITMGGTPESLPLPEGLDQADGVHFVVPSAVSRIESRGNVTVLPYHSQFYYPDLINACDAVVAKVGYSTIAEAYRIGIPMGYIKRARFRESDYLASFIEDNMQAVELAEQEVWTGEWLGRLPDLLSLPRQPRIEKDGAREVARFLLDSIAT